MTPRRERIIYTRAEDNGVGVVIPSARCFAALTGAGLHEDEPWRRSRAFMEMQVRNFGRSTPPVAEAIARRWVMAMAFGGLSPSAFFALLINKDVPEASRSTAELIDVDELPKDRWFRDAWSRSPNGGPITVNLDRARVVQARHVLRRLDELRDMRRGLPPAGLVLLGLSHLPDPERFNLVPVITAINDARDEDDLRRTWPEELGSCVP